MFCVTPENQSALEFAVEQAAKLHEKQASRASCFYTRFFYLGDFDPSYPDLCVKYNDYPVIQCENSMLKHLYTLACEDGDSSPHIARPVHFFYNVSKWGYIVMDRIYQCNVSEHELQIKTAEAVRWLHSKHPPLGTTFGTIGRSYPCNTVFKYIQAPRKFNTVVAVEKYLNMAVPRATKAWKKKLSYISLTNDEVVLSQSDMDPRNFGVAPDGRAIIFDAATIQAMPLTLANFTLLFSSPFADAVSENLFSSKEIKALLRSKNVKSLTGVRRFMKTFAEFIPAGLDDDGNINPV